MSTWQQRARRWGEPLLAGAVAAQAAQEAYVAEGGALLNVPVFAALAAGAALPLRHRAPLVPALLAAGLAAAVGAVLPLVVVVFSFAARERVAAALAWAGAAMVGNLLLQPQHTLWQTRSYGPLLLLVAVVALGMWAGGRRRLVASLAEQVEHLRVERELRAEQARLTERGRVAAELHDSLAHSLSVLALHTGALQRHSGELPGPVADRIDLLRQTSTAALRDLRDVLGSLRAPEAAGGRLRELPELLAEARATGQEVDAEITGEADRLPFSHRLAIYRVVQEGLTNARKHAPGAAAAVRVHHGPPVSTAEVTNAAGEPGERSDGGFGLVGLAERISALGGELAHGPTGSGGWRVAARLPTPTSDDREAE